jgi:hypothetical protein
MIETTNAAAAISIGTENLRNALTRAQPERLGCSATDIGAGGGEEVASGMLITSWMLRVPRGTLRYLVTFTEAA